MTSPCAGRRDRRKDATRLALLASARRLFTAHGYDAVTIEEITAAAGVARRTFFRYFAGKEELLFAAHGARHDRLRAELAAHPGGVPVIDCVREVFDRLAESVPEDPALLRLRIRLIRQTPQLLAANAGTFAAWEADLAAAVGRWTGLAADSCYARTTAACVAAATRAGLQCWYDSGSSRSPRDDVDAALAELARGLQRPTVVVTG